MCVCVFHAGVCKSESEGIEFALEALMKCVKLEATSQDQLLGKCQQALWEKL